MTSIQSQPWMGLEIRTSRLLRPAVSPSPTRLPVLDWQFSCGGGPVGGSGQSFGDETTPLANLDYWGSDFSGNAGILGQSGTYYPSIFGPNAFFNSQFHSLYAWRSTGNANYHALQVTLRK